MCSSTALLRLVPSRYSEMRRQPLVVWTLMVMVSELVSPAGSRTVSRTT